MRATRQFWTTIMNQAMLVCTILVGFIVLAIILAAVIIAPTFLTANAYASCADIKAAVPTIPCPKDQLTLYKVAITLASLSIGCFVIGWVFNLLALAVMDSDAVRDTVANGKKGKAEIVSPPVNFFIASLFTLLGIVLILSGVIAAFGASVTREDWSFKAVATVLSVFAGFGAIFFFSSIIKRTETSVTAVRANL